MFNKEQFLTIANMQDQMNTLVRGADWREQQLDWSVALMVEGGEACDHYSWKWWTPQNRDIDQTQIEIVDMLHFALSGMLVSYDNPEEAFNAIEAGIGTIDQESMERMDEWDVLAFIKETVSHGLIGNFGFSIYLLIRAGKLLGMNEVTLFNKYVGKNVLNKFRKANGYKEGTYIKIWHGEEDNVYLERILREYTLSDITPTPEQLYESLDNIYCNVINPSTPVGNVQH